MEESKPLVSVIITCYNREKYIRRSLESVINQTYKNIEIVVVDDASVDSSVEIIKSYNDDRIRLICLEKNEGVGSSKRTGADNSNGEYICFLDSDDYYKPEYVEINVEKAISGNHDLVLGRKYLDFGRGAILEMPYTLHKGTYQAINAMFLRKDLYNKLDFSKLRLFEDRAVLPKLVYYTTNTGIIPISPYVWVCNKKSAVFGSHTLMRLLYHSLSLIENIQFFSEVDSNYTAITDNRRLLNIYNNFKKEDKEYLASKFPEDYDSYIKYINSLNSNSE